MGGSYTAGETTCIACGKVFKHGDKLNVVNEATYDETEERLEFIPHSETIICEECGINIKT